MGEKFTGELALKQGIADLTYNSEGELFSHLKNWSQATGKRSKTKLQRDGVVTSKLHRFKNTLAILQSGQNRDLRVTLTMGRMLAG
eukprot:CAMPEP_0170492944 /NCGR_PEP_ID=MMETSP0208-20121228/13101_1 /TAXON_ID=197538 /ORGANISM="Strombidium inclinatum, Strain S3" /LENGTH=85 /DNA_ID=CAMNT_0010768783 /DNA_START=536 /DNA_END=789 /DNA_ORIENTATION=-